MPPTGHRARCRPRTTGPTSGLCSPYNDRGNKAETGMTWCLRASCTLGPLLTVEPGRVTGTSASVCTPGPLLQGSARLPGVGGAGDQDATPPPWSPAGSSPSPHPLLLKQSTRAECTGSRWWEWSSVSWEGSSTQAGNSPIGNFFLPVSHLCPVPGSGFKGQQGGTRPA